MRLRLLVLICAVPLVLFAAMPMLSSGATNQQRLGELQNKIEATQGKIGRKKGTEHLLTTQISAWQARINKLQGNISKLQQRESSVQADLDSATADLQGIQSDLREQRARQVRLRAKLKVGRAILARRLVERYQADAPDLVTVILSSDGFAQLLERGEFLKRINDQDERIISNVKSARTDAQDNAVRLSGLETRQQQVTDKIAQRRNEVAAVKQDLIDTRVGYDRTKAGKAKALANVAYERKKLEGSLSAMKATQAKIQGILNGTSGSALPAGPIKGGSGAMIWPVNGPITSPFCERRAWEACHPGIDIGVPSGTPIRAALGGRVALAGPTGGYGNYTCIQHTASLSTCYGHQSSIGVSVGQQVSQGQVIGLSGCTGLCFGPHLHFEVRINGAVTNPMNYL